MNMTGLWTALVTPLRGDRIDDRALTSLLEAQIRGGVSGLVPCGTTGEAATLTPEERRQVISLTLEVAAGRVPVVAGVGSNDTRTTVLAALEAEKLGCQGILVVTPYYNKPPQEGLYRHFRTVAEAVTIDVCAYNVPGRTGVHLEPATLERLMAVTNLTSVKEATGDLKVLSEIQQRCGKRYSLLSGDDFTAFPFLTQGGDGVISVASNPAPTLMAALVQAAQKGDLEEGMRLHTALYPLFRALFLESNPVPVKAALSMMGQIEDELRLPLVPMSSGSRQALRKAMESLGLLESVS